ncbi:flavodoxin [Loigolactobacillus binensis]|uniref:Flavodoxin n=1 Tax=Loigolactobacillus binensis TaxID=2559922 RepID=A0ABW3EB53_9LACO|nr:flavodoxin [Loigolactobacillus binensis]
MEQTKSEQSKQRVVAVKPLQTNLARTQQIMLGFPIWWGTLPQALRAFLALQDWRGKKVYPFCTHEGSGFGRSLDDLHQILPQSSLATGLAVRGSRAFKADRAIENWLNLLEMERSK